MYSLVILLFCTIVCTNGASVIGMGVDNPTDILKQWSFSYQLLQPETTFNYTPSVSVGSSVAVSLGHLLTADTVLDYVVMDQLLSLNDSRLLGRASELRFIPFLPDSIAFLYNLPDIRYTDGRSGTPRLRLSRNTVVNIFLGNINQWNDSRVIADNPNVELPDEPMRVCVRNDISGSTAVMTGTLKKFSSAWKWPASNVFPAELKNLSNFFASFKAYGMRAAIEYFPNSIGYMTYSDVQSSGVLKTTALVENADGEFVGPEEPYVQAALDASVYHVDTNWGEYIDQKGHNVYPFTLMMYFIIKDQISECTGRRELFEWIYWAQTDETGGELIGDLGYSHFTESVKNKMLNFLLTYQCNGVAVLESRYNSQHTGIGYDFFLILGLILLGLGLLLGCSWHYFNQSRCQKVVLLYQTILMIGIALTYISVIFWYKKASTNSTCQSRIWLTTLGYTLILVAMFERTWQIRRVYGKVVNGGKLTSKVTGFLEIGGGIVFLTSIQFIILIVWTVVDPYKSVIINTDPIRLQYEYSCQSNNIDTWLAIESVYFGVLLVWGIYVVYSTWSIKNSVIESRWILISMYNNILLLVLLIALFATLDLDDNKAFYIIVPTIELATTNVSLAAFLPIVLIKLHIMYTSSRDSHATGSSKITAAKSGDFSVEMGAASSGENL